MAEGFSERVANEESVRNQEEKDKVEEDGLIDE